MRSATDHSAEIDLALEVARALHAAGAPAHRLEDALGRLSERLGVRGEFMSTPTALFASFEGCADRRLALCRLDPAGTDLGRMAALAELLDRIADGEVGVAEALGRVRALVSAPSRYGALAILGAFVGASVTAAVFFGGGAWDAIVAGVVGVAVGALSLVADRVAAVSRLFDALAGALAASCAVLAASLGLPVSIYVTTLAGVIVLVPGLSLTVAITELATRHLTSGSARLISSMTTFAMIGAGVALGWRLDALLPVHVTASDPLPPLAIGIGLVVAPISFGVLLRAAPSDIPWIGVVSAVSFGVARVCADAAGPEAGAFAGALTVGLASHLYGRIRKRPIAVTAVPGLILLVPGTMGIRSFAAFASADTISGVDTAFHTVLVALALVTGLLAAQSILPPRRAL